MIHQGIVQVQVAGHTRQEAMGACEFMRVVLIPL